MEITDIRIRRIETLSKLKAVVSVTFDDMFVVHDMKIIEGQEGFFVAIDGIRGDEVITAIENFAMSCQIQNKHVFRSRLFC